MLAADLRRYNADTPFLPPQVAGAKVRLRRRLSRDPAGAGERTADEKTVSIHS